MGVISRIRESRTTDTNLAEARVAAAESDVEILREAIADLELAMEDRGWEQLLTRTQQEFTRAGLTRIAAVARAMAVSDPLIKRGLALRAGYVWGKGVEIQARADGDDGDAADGQGAEQDVNTVIQAFLDDAGNRKAFTGDTARQRLERALGTDGQYFVALFTAPLTGKVQARTIPFDEIVDIITNPDDRTEPWFFKRVWAPVSIDQAGQRAEGMRTAYYPALGYRPANPIPAIEGVPVAWDAPVLHVHVNDLDGWTWGVGDAFPALPWARAYRDFLADWVKVVRSLSQFSWRATAKGSKTQQIRAKLAARPQPQSLAENDRAGAMVVMNEGDALEAIPKSGATIDAGSGRPVAAHVASALGVPVTMLTGDPGVTGARATAETLDVPTELEMGLRRAVHTEELRAICEHVIWASVKAPQGALKGSIRREPGTTRETVTLAGDTDQTIEITWPALSDTPMNLLVAAIVAADSTGKMPPVETLKLLLHALGIRDVDEIVKSMQDEQGNFIDPRVTAGQAAADAFRNGGDPAALVGDQSQQDDEAPTGDDETDTGDH